MSKTKQERREVAFASGASVPGGTVMYLMGGQAHARGHLVRPVKGDGHKNIKDTRRVAYVADKPVFFKAGEVVELEGEIDRGVALAIGEDPAPGTPAKAAAKPGADRDENGDTPEMAQMRRQFDAAYARARTDARRELLDEIEKRNGLIDDADVAAEIAEKAKAALDAETDADKHKPLQKALDDALEAQAKAEKLVNDLPELKA